MAKKKLLAEKYVSALPATLVADTVYYVRTGPGFDIYLTNSAGTVVAYPLNAPAADPALLAAVDRAGHYASPTAMKMQSGIYYDNSFRAGATGTIVLASNTIELAPMYFDKAVSIDQIGAASTATGSGQWKVLIYNTNADNLPASLLWASPAIAVSASANFYYNSPSPALEIPAGSSWVGLWSSATITVRSGDLSGLCNLGLASGNGNAYYSKIRRSLTYSGGTVPDPWSFQASELTTGNPLLVRWRVA